MNNLSWMIYAADVVDRTGPIAVTIILATAVGVYAALSYGAELQGSAYGDVDRDAKGRALQAKALRIGVSVISVALVVILFTPSSNTIYAIAASETGEDILNSERGGKAMQALDAWLDRQIGGDK